METVVGNKELLVIMGFLRDGGMMGRELQNSNNCGGGEIMERGPSSQGDPMVICWLGLF